MTALVAEKGGVLGHVFALDTTGSTAIRAEGDGRAVPLRYRRSVKEDDALCSLAPQ